MLLLLFLICDDVLFSDVINDCQYQLVLAGRESATSKDFFTIIFCIQQKFQDLSLKVFPNILQSHRGSCSTKQKSNLTAFLILKYFRDLKSVYICCKMKQIYPILFSVLKIKANNSTFPKAVSSLYVQDKITLKVSNSN